MKYKICWLENFPDMKSYRQRRKEVRHAEITGDCMGDIEVEVWEYFEAENDEQAKRYVREHYHEREVFTVFRAERVFTEEDI